MNKYAIFAILAVASLATTVSAATGSTSTGSTSTGSTSTGSTSTGTVSTGTVITIKTGGGGVARAMNFTTGKMELYPQCFPYVWLTQFYGGNIFDLYINQNKCRAKRTADFGY